MLHYQLTYPEFREAVRAARRAVRNQHVRTVRWIPLVSLFAAGAAAVFTLLSVTLFYNADWVPRSLGSLTFSARAIVILIVAYLLFLTVALRTSSIRGHWKALAHLTRPHTLVAADDHFAESWDSTSVQCRWSEVTHILHTSRTLALQTSLGLFIIPRTAFPAADLQAFEQLLEAKCPPLPHAFPLSPPPATPAGACHPPSAPAQTPAAATPAPVPPPSSSPPSSPSPQPHPPRPESPST